MLKVPIHVLNEAKPQQKLFDTFLLRVLYIRFYHQSHHYFFGHKNGFRRIDDLFRNRFHDFQRIHGTNIVKLEVLNFLFHLVKGIGVVWIKHEKLFKRANFDVEAHL